MDPVPDSDPDADPDPAIFVSDLQDVTKKLIFCLLLFEGTFTSFFKDKSHKEFTSVSLTYGSGSWRPKKTYGYYGSGSATLGMTVN
jgi:hypothetical protein